MTSISNAPVSIIGRLSIFMCIRTGSSFSTTVKPARLLYFTKKAEQSYTSMRYREDDFLVFGPETRGLPAGNLAGPSRVRAAHPHERRRSAQFEFIQRGCHRAL